MDIRNLTLPEGYRVRHFEILASTNATASELAAAGEPGGLWVIADEQTAGRGSRGRDWVSQKGNLFASLLLDCPCELALASGLTFVSALAVERTVSSLAGENPGNIPETALKWPNDVLLDGAKVSGILLESRTSGSRVQIIVGIGINVFHFPQNVHYPATSLKNCGLNTNLQIIFEILALNFDQLFSLWDAGRNFETIRNLWLEKARGIGETVTVRMGPDGAGLTGVFRDIAANGALMLQTDSGHMETIHVADLFFSRGA